MPARDRGDVGGAAIGAAEFFGTVGSVFRCGADHRRLALVCSIFGGGPFGRMGDLRLVPTVTGRGLLCFGGAVAQNRSTCATQTMFHETEDLGEIDSAENTKPETAQLVLYNEVARQISACR